VQGSPLISFENHRDLLWAATSESSLLLINWSFWPLIGNLRVWDMLGVVCASSQVAGSRLCFSQSVSFQVHPFTVLQYFVLLYSKYFRRISHHRSAADFQCLLASRWLGTKKRSTSFRFGRCRLDGLVPSRSENQGNSRICYYSGILQSEAFGLYLRARHSPGVVILDTPHLLAFQGRGKLPSRRVIWHTKRLCIISMGN
jgi:hypothetical protein